ncbi:MAG: ABC transporter ATP-binding protein [Bryobacteraceae bacterium]
MKRSIQFLLPYLLRHRRSLILGMGSLLIKDILGASLPLVIRMGVDEMTRTFRVETVLWLAAALAGLSVLKGIFQYWMRVILIGLSRDIEYELRNELFAKLTTLDLSYYGRTRTGDILARATNDLNAVRMMLGPAVMYWFETSLTLVLAVGVMMYVDPRLTLLALMPAPLVSFAVIFFGRRIHDRFEAIQTMFSGISSRVQENLAGVRVVRAYAQEEAEIEHFAVLNREYIGENIRLARLSGFFMPLLQALTGMGFMIVLWAGGYRVLQGSLSIGSFVMFNTYMGMLIWPMIAMGWVVNLMQRGTASLGRIRDILEQSPSITPPLQPKVLPTPIRGEVDLDDIVVRFGDRTALNGVSMRIEAGSTVAIVGHTGSGKTTLVNLIPRLLDPESGVVRIDGVDLRDLDPEQVRREIGFVPQETYLFSALLSENIAFGVKDATPEQILEAAEIAGLGPDLASFPNGLDTVVGERGLTLSGGQKQRTAIARAVLRNPRVLILDDALSSVDTMTEERILRALSGVMRGRTTILISHRVSTVRHASRIFVIEHGRVAEQGNHDELVLAGGYYADLYQKQLLEEELEAI